MLATGWVEELARVIGLAAEGRTVYLAATFREVVAETAMPSAETRGVHKDITAQARGRVAVAARAAWAPEGVVVLVEEGVAGDDRRCRKKIRGSCRDERNP